MASSSRRRYLPEKSVDDEYWTISQLSQVRGEVEAVELRKKTMFWIERSRFVLDNTGSVNDLNRKWMLEVEVVYKIEGVASHRKTCFVSFVAGELFAAVVAMAGLPVPVPSMR
jgi:hypothetical protein